MLVKIEIVHCMKSFLIRSFFWAVFSHIWTEFVKIRTRKKAAFEHFSDSGKCVNSLHFYTLFSSDTENLNFSDLMMEQNIGITKCVKDNNKILNLVRRFPRRKLHVLKTFRRPCLFVPPENIRNVCAMQQKGLHHR